MERNTLSKSERLHKRKIIKQLFTQGNSFLIYPYKVFWLDVDCDSQFPAQFGVSVSKKIYKKAVERNKIKRLIREAYRLNKTVLYSKRSGKTKTRVFMLLYVGKEIMNFKSIEEKIIVVLHRLSVADEKTNK